MKAANVLATCCVLLLAVFSVAAAQAGTVQFTSSSQLLMSQNVAAVNFYYSSHDGDPNGGVQVTAPIQGVAFQNLDVVNNNLLPVTLSGGGALTIDLPNTTSLDARAESATIGGPDGAAATQLATSISYFSGVDSGSLKFSFGSALANSNVYVQIVGGDEGWSGKFTASVGGTAEGTISGDSNTSTAQLLTFVTKTDGSGNLEVDLKGNSDYAGIAGVIVSTPEPSTFVLGLAGLVGLAAAIRRRRCA